jgi:hypothetical protein
VEEQLNNINKQIKKGDRTSKRCLKLMNWFWTILKIVIEEKELALHTYS